jgi:hypothetical protein
MASGVSACRREIRRQRILENSENRLQKIIGRSDNISKGNILIIKECILLLIYIKSQIFLTVTTRLSILSFTLTV